MMMHDLQRILLVEDEKDIQIVARLALEDIGTFQVLVCSSGQEALAKAPAFEPDLILLDVLMPDLDGLATLEAMRGVPSLASVPVIFLTARARSQDVQEYRRAGALDVILKPFDPLTLAEQIRGVWHAAGLDGDAGG
jgi:CheY-like chemotaxis protein